MSADELYKKVFALLSEVSLEDSVREDISRCVDILEELSIDFEKKMNERPELNRNRTQIVLKIFFEVFQEYYLKFLLKRIIRESKTKEPEKYQNPG